MDIASEQLFQVVQEVGRSMLDMEFEQTDGLNAAPGALLAAGVGIRGQWNGAVIVECSRGLGQRLAAAFFGLPESEVTSRDTSEALEEFVNILAGNLKGLIPVSTNLDLPDTAPTPALYSVLPGDCLSRAIVACNGEPLVVMLVSSGAEQWHPVLVV